ncbi:acetyl-CoA hydrolase/transferase family protein [Piscinibacter sp.]|uniref:acetyl-CoA hydrolase/transferase family protein n=1 Tax=Piscinibacter sp. TaxID=1903157 RepID=UPI002CBB916C|nr:acetyl-CoA hydrolase/transferase C-terminal domain-containing protein [Albitalea sp.]HUG21842.1 acetyl-CoA hydrolase/transferase C-terminal domain-containing protein [Albitalea sp.]
MSGVPDLSAFIHPGDTVLWGQAGAEPLTLTRALVEQRQRLGRPRLFLGIGQSGVLQPEHADAFDFLAYCGSGSNRALAAAGVLDILPCHYSQLPALMRCGALRVDVVMLQVSPPDEQGRHSLGLANEYLLAALDSARVVLAEVNDQVPWTHGERCLRGDEIDLRVGASYAPWAAEATPAGPVEQDIARHVAGLIDDGCTLQTGLGALPDAVLRALVDRRDLGVHSGVIGDGVAALCEAGVVTNARKTIDRGVSVGGLLMGSARLHRFAHRNERLRLRSTDYTHDASVLAAIDRFVAVNSAIEVDLSGQVNAEVANGVYVGAVGGALDFLRGAQRSRGGLPIIALPSTTGARSRIVARLSGPVSTPRSDAALIVTEHGVADLRGLPLSRRVDRLLAIADPRHRDALARDARLVHPRTA